jgi:succinate dehydrogenase hydrophobic anchor subunit
MTYEAQLWIMTVICALVTVILLYWLALFMATEEDMKPAPVSLVSPYSN